jgi:ATP-dependent Clp protease ATP-binding subunit ClpC
MTFTPRCQRAIESAKASLARFGHSHVSSAHLVLGVLELEQGVAVSVLVKFGISIDQVENYLSAKRSSDDDRPAEETPLIGKSAEVAFKRAEAAAAKLGHTYVGTEHLLLAILVEESGPAADLFVSLNADRKAIGSEVFKEIAPAELWMQMPEAEHN